MFHKWHSALAHRFPLVFAADVELPVIQTIKTIRDARKTGDSLVLPSRVDVLQ